MIGHRRPAVKKTRRVGEWTDSFILLARVAVLDWSGCFLFWPRPHRSAGDPTASPTSCPKDSSSELPSGVGDPRNITDRFAEISRGTGRPTFSAGFCTAGERMYLWQAVDHEGEVLDMLIQRRRDTRAALRLMRKLLKKQGFAPKLLVTDKLRSYASALRRLRLACPHEQGLRSRVDDWRGVRRFCEALLFPAAFADAGVAVRTVAPFPVAAHQTGRADFRHPAFTHPIRLSLSAGGRAGWNAVEPERVVHSPA